MSEFKVYNEDYKEKYNLIKKKCNELGNINLLTDEEKEFCDLVSNLEILCQKYREELDELSSRNSELHSKMEDKLLFKKQLEDFQKQEQILLNIRRKYKDD